MPLRTETYDLEAEADRLEKRCQEIADKAVQAETETATQRLLAEGRQLDAQLAGVRWAMRAHEEDGVPAWDEAVDTITLGGLTGGEFGRIEDDLTTADEDVGGGATRVHLVASGTVDAPYVSDEMGERETIAAVASLPLPFLKWAESQINDLTGIDEGNGKRFSDFLQASRRQTTDE